MSSIQADSAAFSAQDWASALALYRRPSFTRAGFEIAVTLLPFVAVWIAMLVAIHSGHIWLSFAMTPVAAGLLVRLFMIQHDCGHGAFTPSKAVNDWIGRAIGVLTMTPYDLWRRSHAIHHATSGNLDRRGVGDIDTLTVKEYFSRSWRARLAYRLYRHPLVMFGLGPIYVFLIQNRLPVGFMRKGAMPWWSTMATNAAIVVVAALIAWGAGLGPLLLIHLPIVAVSATIGVWLFYVQHQFEETNWEHAGHWSHAEAALHGSSLYELPQPLSWFSANIGIHHVHHLSSGIPYYRLREVLQDHPALQNISRLGLIESLACVRLTLWDEDKRKLVSFREARAAR